MKIEENIPLHKYNTFRIGGPARFFASVQNIDELREALNFAKENNVKTYFLGEGSNTIFSDRGFGGLVVKNEMKRMEIIEENEHIDVIVGAGENWDSFVKKTVENNLWGLENLSLIPGAVGAAPIQNIGAYGVEVRDSINFVDALNTESLVEKRFQNKDCNFSYRNSFFKKEEGKKYFITKVSFRLSKKRNTILTYKDVLEYFDGKDVDHISQSEIRKAIVEIRENKLPDISQVGTVGSFFKNPIISKKYCQRLLKKYPAIPTWPQGDECKVSLAYILDNVCNLKGTEKYNFLFYEKQPLVIVNTGKGKYRNLKRLINETTREVFKKTEIKIEPEVNLIS